MRFQNYIKEDYSRLEDFMYIRDLKDFLFFEKILEAPKLYFLNKEN